MKKLFGLLLGLCFMITYSVNAETIDMKNEYFTPYSIHKTGDVYENANIYDDRIEFYTPEGGMFYVDRSRYVDSPINSRKFEHQYYTLVWTDYDVFHIDDGIYTDFIIPTYFNEKPLWLYEKIEHVYKELPNSSMLGDIGERDYYDSFIPFISEPKFVIDCEEREVKVGDTVKCSLKYKYSLYSNGIKPILGLPINPTGELEGRKKNLVPEELNYGIHPLNVDLTLISPDYVINNINESFISNLQIDDNHVKGLVYDSERVYEAASYYSYSQMKSNLSDNLKFEEEEIHRISCDDMAQSYRKLGNENKLGGSFEETEDGCFYKVYKTNYEFTVLTFDAIPKDDASDVGSILASNAKFKLYDSEEQEVVGDLDYVTGDAQIDVPITGLVKGVEEVQENPKTGIFNTILLMIPILLFGLGYYLIMKKNIFKFNK